MELCTYVDTGYFNFAKPLSTTRAAEEVFKSPLSDGEYVISFQGYDTDAILINSSALRDKEGRGGGVRVARLGSGEVTIYICDTMFRFCFV